MHNLLDLDTFSRADIDRVMKTTHEIEQPHHRLKLEKITICNLFFEPSTRTVASFEIAGKSLGGNVINISPTTSSVAKGESIIDTIKTLSAMGVSVFVIRHSHAGTPWLVEQHTNAHIINAGDGDHAHPTQALIDAYVLQKHLSGSAWGGLKQKNIVIVGDIAHSRVAKSNIWALSALGAHITLVAPDYFLAPPTTHNDQWKNPFELPNVEHEPNLNRALKTADAVMALRIQKERLQKTTYSEQEYIQNYQINAQRMKQTQPHTLLLHPGPINQGVEITADVAYGSQSCVQEQVSAGVAIRKAILALVCSQPN